ncbi:hypothetical protein COU91_02195 [Candidatus Saccharibacteria bacterium CG10_big_fil_rev_8_21_14_0_10_47_8]|nr:MAG: hypothetical protein COU91_02195 [Candidatus Saccharibacteria bacterium CG10_big_fil_rev_8_21_14_0_10_47_8]
MALIPLPLKKLFESFNLSLTKRNSPTSRIRNTQKNSIDSVNASPNSFSNNSTDSNNTTINISERSDLHPIKIAELVTPNFPEIRNKVFKNKDI